MIAMLQRTRQRLGGTFVERILKATGLGRVGLRAYEACVLHRGWHSLSMFGTIFKFQASSRIEVTQIDMQANTEREYVARLLDVIQPGDVIYDIGANIGYVSLVLGARAPHATRILAFEPDPDNAAHLRTNIHCNGVQNITVYEVALGNETGRCVLFVEGEVGTGTHSIVGSKDGRSRRIEVNVVSGADFVKQGHPNPDILKIDVEGAEANVLYGFEPLLERGLVREIFVEMHPERLAQAGTNAESLTRWLKHRGYDCASARRRGSEMHCHFRRTCRRTDMQGTNSGGSTSRAHCSCDVQDHGKHYSE